MSSIDISPFVEAAVKRLLAALAQSGLDLEHVTLKANQKFPFGSWKHPVLVYSWDRPVARYWLTYPVKDGQKTVKFNVETFEAIKEWLKPKPQPQPSPAPSASTDSTTTGEV